MPVISFPDGSAIDVPAQTSLAVSLDVINSPVLFGCRTGICATCLVEVQSDWEDLPPPSEDEQEVIELYTDRPHCRLACQLRPEKDLQLAYIGNK